MQAPIAAVHRCLQHGGAAAAGGSLVRRRPPDGWLLVDVCVIDIASCCVEIVCVVLALPLTQWSLYKHYQPINQATKLTYR
jgi:hypothetical protein